MIFYNKLAKKNKK